MERTRDIIFLIPTLRGGGSERVVVNLLRHLNTARYRSSLAVVDMRDAAYQGELAGAVEIIDLKSSRVRYALPKLVTLIRRRRPDIVFSTLGHLNLAISIVRPLLPASVRYIARESNVVSETLRQYTLSSLWRWAYRQFYARFDRVICQSVHMYDDLVRNYGLPREKGVVIPNPVDVQHIRRLAREAGTSAEREHGSTVNLVAAGRLSDQKGFDLLIEAVALCANQRLRLTILGEGPLRGNLEEQARLRGIADQISFVGFQANPYAFFAQADAFVLSSRYEGLPNAMLEALACGTPVIAVPSRGGVIDILQGLRGCHVADEISAPALAAALAKLRPGSRAPLECMLPFEASTIARRYEQLFEAALA